MKYITLKNNEGIVTALIDEVHNNKVEIHELNNWADPKKVYGINWSANGTVKAKEAKYYGELLIKAAKIVDKMNGDTQAEIDTVLAMSSYEDSILQLVEDQMSTDGRDLTQSDLQGVVSVIVRKIYNHD